MCVYVGSWVLSTSGDAHALWTAAVVWSRSPLVPLLLLSRPRELTSLLVSLLLVQIRFRL